MLFELYKVFLQFFMLAVLGGWISWYYTQLQKRKELKVDLTKEYSRLHGSLIALRFRYNSFYVRWKDMPDGQQHILDENQIKREKWKLYEEACRLIGEYQGIKPLLVVQFNEVDSELNKLHEYYQNWRRDISKGRPILQDMNGKNDPKFNEMRQHYQRVIASMRKQI